MKMKDRISEREYQGRLESLLKSETATKKRRALKKKVAKNSGLTKSSATASG